MKAGNGTSSCHCVQNIPVTMAFKSDSSITCEIVAHSIDIAPTTLSELDHLCIFMSNQWAITRELNASLAALHRDDRDAWIGCKGLTL